MSDIASLDPAPFSTWAAGEGYDIAQTYDTERSRWVFFSPMTADLWKCWQAAKADSSTLARSALRERDQRIEELEEALQLARDHLRGGYVTYTTLEVLDKLGAVLNKEKTA